MSSGKTFEVDYHQTVIFLKGNLSEGYTAFGPYPDHVDAWVAHDHQEGWTMTLSEKPPLHGTMDDLTATEIEPGSDPIGALLLIGEFNHGYTLAGIYRDLDAAASDDPDRNAIAIPLHRGLSGVIAGKEVVRLTSPVTATS